MERISNSNDGYELTAYIGNVLNEKTVIAEVSKIKIAFPALSPQFIDVLIERAIAKGFTSQRLIDAVNNVIDNCQYPTPTLANFLSFDKRIKIYSYNEICNFVTSHKTTFENYVRITVNNQQFFISKADKEYFNIPDKF